MFFINVIKICGHDFQFLIWPNTSGHNLPVAAGPMATTRTSQLRQCDADSDNSCLASGDHLTTGVLQRMSHFNNNTADLDNL